MKFHYALLRKQSRSIPRFGFVFVIHDFALKSSIVLDFSPASFSLRVFDPFYKHRVTLNLVNVLV
jgi:hypothetical protein